MAERQIVAMAAAAPGCRRRRVLGLVRAVPRVLYVGTASAEDPRNRTVDLRPLPRQGRASGALEFFPWPPDDLRELTLAQDVIFVGGGNTANMLAIWRVHGFDAILREAWEQGIVLTGGSAGMICWFEAGVTDSFGPQLEGMRDGLGFLPGQRLPALRRRGAAPADLPAPGRRGGLPAGLRRRRRRRRCTSSAPSWSRC